LTLTLAQVPFPDWSWLANPRNWERLAGFAVEHAELTVFAVLAGALMAAPLALLAVRRRAFYTPLLTATGVLFTVPSLAMFLLIIALFGTGFSRTTAVLGLGV
jgi:osmoprotectant transport system permease protein